MKNQFDKCKCGHNRIGHERHRAKPAGECPARPVSCEELCIALLHISDKVSPEDASRIQHAMQIVDCHEAMISALKEAQDAFKRYDLANIGSASIVNNAIAKATGEGWAA